MALSRREAGKLGYEKIKHKLDENRALPRKNYEQNKKSCKFCGSVFEFEQRRNKFCNQSCAAKYNNPLKKTINYCLGCEKELKKNSNKYCSNACHQNKIMEDAVKNNEASSVTIKAYLIKIHGAKCMECGWNKVSQYTNKVPIELEHIDGNSSNNSLNNVKLLCPNCHSLTSTYKALNKGNGRHKRMKRYREGKSF